MQSSDEDCVKKCGHCRHVKLCVNDEKRRVLCSVGGLAQASKTSLKQCVALTNLNVFLRVEYTLASLMSRPTAPLSDLWIMS